MLLRTTCFRDGTCDALAFLRAVCGMMICLVFLAVLAEEAVRIRWNDQIIASHIKSQKLSVLFHTSKPMCAEIPQQKKVAGASDTWHACLHVIADSEMM